MTRLISKLTSFKSRIKWQTWVALTIIAILSPIAYLTLVKPEATKAAWWNGDWQYRKVIPISSHTSLESNVYIAITAYDASDTTKYQTDCGDVRFTKENGELLPYTVTSCGASTTFNVLFDTFPAGAQDIYLYYGNPNAPNGFQTTAFATEASGYVIGTVGSEATTPGPVAWWKFDEGQGQTVNDNTTKSNGTLGADSSAASDDPTWIAEDRCVTGKCLQFDGSNDYVNFSGSIVGVQSVGFWVKPTSTTASMIALTSGARITASSGTISATGFTSPTIYVNGLVSTTFTANQWNYIEVTTGTAITANAITIGTANAAFTTGFIDDVKIYPYARSAAEVKADFSAGAAVLGAQDQKDFLSDGLVGYWKLDESSGNAADSSGNSLTLTNNATTTYVAGKFGNGSEHVPASLQYLNTATTIAGVKTVSFWVNPDVTGNYYIDLDGGTNYISDSGGTLSATGFTSPTIYVNGAVSTTVTANTWQLVTVTTNTAISASAFAVGKIGSNYFDGTMDDVRIYNRALSPDDVRNLYNWAPGPVGHWNLDEGSGTAANDISGNSNTGTITNATYTNGKYGKGLNFDGTGDYVTRADDADFDFAAADGFTVSGWFKHQTASAAQYIFTKSQAGTNGGYKIYMASDGDIVFDIDDDSTWTPDDTVTTTAATYDDNAWHYFTAAKNGTTGIYIYIDGVLIASDTSIAATGTLANDDAIYIGIGRRFK